MAELFFEADILEELIRENMDMGWGEPVLPPTPPPLVLFLHGDGLFPTREEKVVEPKHGEKSLEEIVKETEELKKELDEAPPQEVQVPKTKADFLALGWTSEQYDQRRAEFLRGWEDRMKMEKERKEQERLEQERLRQEEEARERERQRIRERELRRIEERQRRLRIQLLNEEIAEGNRMLRDAMRRLEEDEGFGDQATDEEELEFELEFEADGRPLD